MPGWIFKEGEFRELKPPSINVNGQIKKADVYTKVNNEYRLIFGGVTYEDIVGFRLVYKVIKDIKNGILNYLPYNPLIPHRVDTTSNKSDTNEKDFLFEYFNESNEEGIICYEGILYASLNNGMNLDVLNTNKNNIGIDSIDKVLITDAEEFKLTISCETRYESYGFNTFGWNSIFTKNELLPPRTNKDKEIQKNVLTVDDYDLIPVTNDNFRNSCLAGIARDLAVKDFHMIGSSGLFSQTINQILVNDIIMPFTIEIVR